MSSENGYSKPAVAGTGAIASGLAAATTVASDVIVLARSEESAERARASIEKLCGKLEGGDASRATVTTEIGDLSGCDLIAEAIVEDRDAKIELHKQLAETAPEADLATTTSSLGIGDLGEAIGAADRFYGLHVFNPPTRMDLVELCLPGGLRNGVGERAHAFCDALGKKAIEVADHAGFVVNRLLFPFLFDAVRLMEKTGTPAPDIDACMKMGAGHPMGPMALLDFVGLDVSAAIGESLYADSGDESHRAPETLRRLIDEGKLGRKTGEGLLSYDR